MEARLRQNSSFTSCNREVLVLRQLVSVCRSFLIFWYAEYIWPRWCFWTVRQTIKFKLLRLLLKKLQRLSLLRRPRKRSLRKKKLSRLHLQPQRLHHRHLHHQQLQVCEVFLRFFYAINLFFGAFVTMMIFHLRKTTNSIKHTYFVASIMNLL